MRPVTLLQRSFTLVGAVSLAGALLATPVSAQQAANLVTVSAPKPVGPPKPFARLSASAESLRDSLIALTRGQLGVPYRRGQSSPDHGFDCSGLVKFVMERFGASVPRTASQQALVGKRIERDIASLKPGDLLTFGKGKRGASHIGIYIGDGRFVHASTKAGRVIESKLDRPLYRGVKPWIGVRRLIAADDDSATANATKGSN